MTDTAIEEFTRNELCIMQGAMVRSYNAKLRRGPGKERPSAWSMTMADKKRVIDKLNARIEVMPVRTS